MSNSFASIAQKFNAEAENCKRCKNKCSVDPTSAVRLVTRAPASFDAEDRFYGCIAIVGTQRQSNVRAEGPGFVHYSNDPAQARGLVKTPMEIALRDAIVAARSATGLRLPVYAIPTFRCPVAVDENGKYKNRGWDTVAAHSCIRAFSSELDEIAPRVAITFGISVDPFKGKEVYQREGVQTYTLTGIEHPIGRISRNGGHLRLEVNTHSWQPCGPQVADAICQAIVDAARTGAQPG